MHALRTFVQRTAMLRNSGFPHVAAMLVAIATSDHSVADLHAGHAHEDPALVTEAEATTIGGTFAAMLAGSPTPSPVGAVGALAQGFEAVSALCRKYSWFAPMLEVAAQRLLGTRGSHVGLDLARRLSTIHTNTLKPVGPPRSPSVRSAINALHIRVAPTSNIDESASFESVVR